MTRRYLKVVYDVTGLTDEQVGALELEAAVQAEASSDFTEDEPGTGHPDVPVESYVFEDDEENEASLRPRPGETAEDTLNRVLAAVRDEKEGDDG
jgi:hypothetical protein